MRIEFRHQAVRDLAWIIGSPGLLRSGPPERVADHWCRLAFLDRLPWLRHLDNHPAALEAWLEGRRGRRVGHYFEALIAFWLTQWPEVELLASHLQVEGEGRTLGEFDFLFRDRYRDRTVHWECTVKYFLREQLPDGESVWPGPNPRDTLQGKLEKLFGRQLRLSSLQEAKRLLAQRGIAAPDSRAFFKGYLFYPAGSDRRQAHPLPAAVSPEHLRGWWCRVDRLAQIPALDGNSRWLPLQRPYWLSPVVEQGPEAGMRRSELEAWVARHFAGSERPLLLAELQAGTDGRWREVSRGFVVPLHWPHPDSRG